MADPVVADVFANADLVHKILKHLPFNYLALDGLRINHAFCAAAQERFQKVRPLLAPPFNLRPGDVLHAYSYSSGSTDEDDEDDDDVEDQEEEEDDDACRHVRLAERMGDDGLRSLASACASGAMANLQVLHISSNNFGDAGCAALADACAKGALANLKVLYLEGNKIGDAGCAALAGACAKGALAKLEKLFLNGNQIGDAGFTSLVDAVAKGALAQVKSIYLYNNRIGDVGCAALAKAIANGSLRNPEFGIMQGLGAGWQRPLTMPLTLSETP